MPSLKAGWRPAMGWCYAFIWTACGIVILVRVLFGWTSLTDATPLLMALIAGGAAPVTTYTYGRTTEKREGVSDLPPADFPPPDFVTNAPPISDEREPR